MKRFLIVLAAMLALAGQAHAQEGQYHQGLGDDPIVGRDIPGDIEAAAPSNRLLQGALATSSQRGCTTRFQTRNFSSRAGVAPGLLVAHYTVSRNVAGWADVNAIWNWFNQARASASSHYIIDFEGHCLYAVAETAKAWTQGAYNPESISIEFIATGSERVWPNAALRKGAQVFADASKRWGIPIRLVDPVGCGSPRGVTDHNRLECGNNHTDVAPHFPMAKFVRFVREAAAPPPPPRTYFRLLGPGGNVNAESSKVAVGFETEAARLQTFLANYNLAIANRLLRSGSITIVRGDAQVATLPGDAGDVGRVRFLLLGPAGGVHASSAGATTRDGELRRIRIFLRGHTEVVTTRLQRAGSMVLVRQHKPLCSCG